MPCVVKNSARDVPKKPEPPAMTTCEEMGEVVTNRHP